MRKGKENAILEYITNFADQYGFPPSVREIAAHFDIKSTSTVAYYLDKLKLQGKISNEHSKRRAICIKQKQTANSIPLVGDVSCGQGILAVENIDGHYPVPQDFFPQDDLFMLRADGDSMVNVGIYSGDYVIVHRQPTVKIGEIAVVMWDDVASVKRVVAFSPNLVLHPENDAMDDTVLTVDNNPSILGKVVGSIRRF